MFIIIEISVHKDPDTFASDAVRRYVGLFGPLEMARQIAAGSQMLASDAVESAVNEFIDRCADQQPQEA